MKIGVFDSGLGGLLLLRAMVKKLPAYDYVYLGDTKRVPYGNRSQDTIYEFLEEAVEYLFKQNCQLIIVACNTASAQALRKIQKNYLPKHYPDRRVLGVIIPTAEAAVASGAKNTGVLATAGTVNSGAFVRELKKLDKKIQVWQEAAPLLVPLVEQGELKWAEPIVKGYLKPLLKHKIDSLILGCTHYPRLKSMIRKLVGKGVKVISQDEVVPAKLADYLKRHPEIEKKLSKGRGRKLLVTDITPEAEKLARNWFRKGAVLRRVYI
ncbi:MAG: glutamate racemase [Patescibacteria group bacterium]|nr:glutamate racemase [Patescibacteria group bacterium]